MYQNLTMFEGNRFFYLGNDVRVKIYACSYTLLFISNTIKTKKQCSSPTLMAELHLIQQGWNLEQVMGGGGH